MTESIQALMSAKAYQESRAHLFPSTQSLSWFIRTHRQELIDGGALHVIAGRNVLQEAKTDEVVLAIGRQSAQRAAA